jgi:hypothetical protein
LAQVSPGLQVPLPQQPGHCALHWSLARVAHAESHELVQQKESAAHTHC